MAENAPRAAVAPGAQAIFMVAVPRTLCRLRSVLTVLSLLSPR
jgi:hypothetical protein